MANTRKYAQAFPATAVLLSIIVFVCGAGFLVKALLVKHEVDTGGERVKRLERDLAEISNRNRALLTRKEELTSVPELKKAVERGFVKLSKINDASVITVGQRATVQNDAAPAAQDVRVILTSAAKGNQ